MNKLIAFISLLLFSISCFAQEYDFRKIKWGYTIKQVRESEPLNWEQGKAPDGVGYLMAETKVAELRAIVRFLFLDDKLGQAQYNFLRPTSEENEYIGDYNKLVKILTIKYGNPTSVDDEEWKDDTFRYDKSAWGQAIAQGHLSYASYWMYKHIIFIRLRGVNHLAQLTMTYNSPTWLKDYDAFKVKDFIDEFE